MLKYDMMKNLKMWEDVIKTLKMRNAIKTLEMRGDTIKMSGDVVQALKIWGDAIWPRREAMQSTCNVV